MRPERTNNLGAYHKCQCPLFKQFTTAGLVAVVCVGVLIISVNVLFLSNSQLIHSFNVGIDGCLS